jgi:branched-chain amino acid transport system permease protein
VGTFVSYALPGIPTGCEYALMAVGLVITFRATGVFNIAFGAQAFVSAFAFDLLNQYGPHWNQLLSFVIAVLVVAPLMGLALDRFLFRHIPTASTTVKLVSSLGLLVAIPQTIPIIFGAAPRYNIGYFWLNPQTVYFHAAGIPINGWQITNTVLTVVVVGGLMAVFKWTSVGLKMRAVVESRRLSQLEGVNASGVAAGAWALSSALAGLSGVLLLPVQNPLDPTNTLSFTTLLVAGITAAAIASLRSIPVAFVAGLLIGIAQQILTLALPSSSSLAASFRQEALPFILLAGVLLFNKSLRRIEESADPLASVDPPPPPPASQIRDRRLELPTKWGWRALLVAFVVSVLTWMPPNWVFGVFGVGIAFSIIFLSMTLITGMSGQVSLCQMAFAGIGGFAAGQLANHLNLPILVGSLIGAVIAAAVGAVIAVIAIRISGLALALFTLAFALLCDQLLFNFSWSGNGQQGITSPRPQIGSIDFLTGNPGDRYYVILITIVLAICMFAVMLIQKGTFGRFLSAMRGSPTAAASMGINLTKSKITVFALSAAVAGLGGALYGSLEGPISSTDFAYELSLAFVVVVITTGTFTVEGAVQAGIGFALFQFILDFQIFSRIQGIEFVLFAFGAFTYAKHPEGIVEFQKTRWMNRVAKVLQRWDARHGREPSELQPDPPGLDPTQPDTEALVGGVPRA